METKTIALNTQCIHTKGYNNSEQYIDARGESSGVVGGGGLRLADQSTMRQDDGWMLWLAHRSCGRVAVSLCGRKETSGKPRDWRAGRKTSGDTRPIMDRLTATLPSCVRGLACKNKQVSQPQATWKLKLGLCRKETTVVDAHSDPRAAILTVRFQ